MSILRAHLPTVCAAILILAGAAGILAQPCAPGELRVIVTDSQQSPIFDAEVRVASAGATLPPRSTQTAGLADFQNIACGSWNITIHKDGFDDAAKAVDIAGGSRVSVALILVPRMQHTKVEVTDDAPLVEQTSSESTKIHPAEVKTLPTNPATVNDTLPLLPGIVRTPDGELKIDGSGEERSAMIVNQSDITDPATGKFGQSVPVDSIDTVNVLNTPFLAQYGRFTQSVVAVETKRGGEKWHAELNDPFPDFRIRSYHMHGIRDATPRFVAGGPVVRDHLYLISAFQYSFAAVPNRTLPFPYNESRQESVNSFTQADLILSPKQIVTATFHASPQHVNFVNPDFFNPEPATPSYRQHNYVGTAVHHFGFLGGILDSSISGQRFDAIVGAQGSDEMVLTPLGSQGNFFGTQNRDAHRTEWLETWSLAPLTLVGKHLVKLGDSVTWSSNQGQFAYRPVQIRDAAGLLEERVDFANQTPFARTDLEVTAYVQDHWSLTPRLSFDYGARIEHQRLASSLRIAPREGIAWSPFGDSRTVLRAGFGQFYDHLPLDIYTFSRYPRRTITMFAPGGRVAEGPFPYVNVIGSITGPRSFLIHGQQVAGAFSPRGATLNLQMEHRFTRLLQVRAVVTDNRSVGLVVLERAALGTTDEIVLNGNGKSRYRQVELTARAAWKDGQELVLSYTRSRAEGNLNTFDTFLGNYPLPLIRPNLYTSLPADLPHRFLLWGRVNSHFWGLTVMPMVECHTGFPYARMDALQNYAGIPYSDRTRFPRFFSADARILKDFKVSPKYTLRLSLTALNITNHFNALSVHNNTGDPQCGLFFGNYRRRYRGDFDVIF